MPHTSGRLPRGTLKGQGRKAYGIVSLFSGAMGLDLGLEAAGFQVKLALEINKAARDTIKLNRPTLPLIEKSIGETSSREILEKAGLRKKEVTIVSAGPCCQSFSTAGKRQSVSDERGNLFREFCRIVSDLRPRFFLMENVKGILSAAIKHRLLDQRGPGFPPLSKEEQLGSALELIVQELQKLDYYVVYGLLNAADYGVPQTRWRVFFIGSRDGEDISLPHPTHCDPRTYEPQSRLAKWVTLRQALKGICASEWCDFGEERLELLRRLRAGQDWRDLPRRLHRRALGAAFDSWGGRTGFCRRLSWGQPSPTLTTDPTGRATTLCHPVKNRPLSVEEYAALQQFRAEWHFTGSVHQKYVQIGNAVPVGLGAAVGQMLRRAMRASQKHGISAKNLKRRGEVVCGDLELEHRLKNRRKTLLHPPHLRKTPDPEAARKWLAASG